MSVDNPWMRYPIGRRGDETSSFSRNEWNLGSERMIGRSFAELAQRIIRESRFHPIKFVPSDEMRNYHGGIIQANFKMFHPNKHEAPGVHRQTGEGGHEYWESVPIGPKGELIGYNPIEDPLLKSHGTAVALVSRVTLNNLTNPGTFGGWAHIPLFDITKPATSENITHVITELKRRTNLDKFFVLRSSDHGMMVVGPELVSEDHLENMWDNAELMNHYEVNKDDMWFDSRWHARSKQNFQHDLGLPNTQRVAGVLRMTAAPPIKPDVPVVVAASF